MARTHRMVGELVAVGLLAAIALGLGINRAGMASGYVDPLLHAGAQDEAVYGHAAARMVRTGHWMTPVFLDRFMLNKPPLLMWLGAASMRVAGINPLALRLPVLAAGVLCCLLIYWWLRRSLSMAAGMLGVLLLLGTPLFHSMARKFMTDALLTLFVVAAMFILASDPHWERRWTAFIFGALSGAAVMTKSAAGLLPLLILVVYWAVGGPKQRPPAGKILLAFAVAVLVAAPWHVYEFVVHRDWFIAEYVRFQLLGSGVTAPSRYTGDTNFWFYLRTLLRTDPILLVLSVTGLPWVAMAWRKSDEARLLAAWFLTSALCLGVFGTRAAYYLLPLLPVLVLMSVGFSPLLRGRLAWVACAVLAVVYLAGSPLRSVDYAAKSVPSASALDSYSRLRRANELLIVSPDDEFYASVVDLPKVRYVYLAPLDATKTSEFFYRLGMILSSDEFCSLASLLPVYEQRLQAWKLPESLHPEGTLVSGPDLAEVIRCSPDRDFMLPEDQRAIAADAGAATHTATPDQSGRFFLLSKTSSRRPEGSIAPGTVVPDQPR
ncbi:MAG TPA: glycosyltransferase family 39 protein [Bryobacteraceae bacterium]|nr:glycosyltransferase family 39 protein [Bryobacteraceae bacterium]